jgi:hypothetical protein
MGYKKSCYLKRKLRFVEMYCAKYARLERVSRPVEIKVISRTNKFRNGEEVKVCVRIGFRWEWYW